MNLIVGVKGHCRIRRRLRWPLRSIGRCGQCNLSCMVCNIAWIRAGDRLICVCPSILQLFQCYLEPGNPNAVIGVSTLQLQKVKEAPKKHRCNTFHKFWSQSLDKVLHTIGGLQSCTFEHLLEELCGAAESVSQGGASLFNF